MPVSAALSCYLGVSYYFLSSQGEFLVVNSEIFFLVFVFFPNTLHWHHSNPFHRADTPCGTITVCHNCFCLSGDSSVLRTIGCPLVPLLTSVEVGSLITVLYVGQGLTMLSNNPQRKAKHCILHGNSERQVSRKQGRKNYVLLSQS